MGHLVQHSYCSGALFNIFLYFAVSQILLEVCMRFDAIFVAGMSTMFTTWWTTLLSSRRLPMKSATPSQIPSVFSKMLTRQVMISVFDAAVFFSARASVLAWLTLQRDFWNFIWHYFYLQRCASAVYAVVVCLSVCVSVTLWLVWYCIKMAEHRITQIKPHDIL